jgi:hypothetical protein
LLDVFPVFSNYYFIELFIPNFISDTVTSSYVPVKPFPSPPIQPPAVEIEEFIPEKGQFNNPHNSYVNNIYVYPISLKYDSQKTFTKVNILVP